MADGGGPSELELKFANIGIEGKKGEQNGYPCIVKEHDARDYRNDPMKDPAWAAYFKIVKEDINALYSEGKVTHRELLSNMLAAEIE